jgi:tetratricopeptide (TPR) repeat protein
MADDAFHLTRDLLWALHKKTRNPGDLVAVVISHLFELCPTCSNEFEAFRAGLEESGEALHSPAVERVVKHARRLEPRVEKAKKEAEPKVMELLALSHKERLEQIRGASSPYRGAALAYLLLQASRERFCAKPQEALQLAELSQAVIAHEEVSPLSMEIYARAMAYAGNAKRVSGEPQTAIEDFEHARYLLRMLGGGDRLVQAEIDSLEGSLSYALREMERARQLFHRAAITYSLEGETTTAARCWVKLSLALREDKKFVDGILAVEKALGSFAHESDPLLLLQCRHCLAFCLCDAGRPQEAQEILEESRDLYAEHADAISLLRLAWLRGMIARGLGDLEQAESHFLAARRGFQQAGIAYDMALVSLELAGVYLAQRRAEEVKDLAMEMVAEFRRQGVGREVLSAVILFQEAAKLERVTLAWLQKLIDYLPRAQRDPEHAFEVGS